MLLGIAMLAMGGLALTPAAAPVTDVLLAQAAVSSPLAIETRHDVLSRLGNKAPAVVKPAPKSAAKPVVAPKKAAPRPAVKRVSRSTRVAASFGSGYFCPVAGKRSFSNDYGDARSGGRSHQGNDIMSPYGTPLVAVTAGTVKTAYSSAGGISLYLRGVDGNEYFYAHNSRNAASSGERVAAGEVIAYVGSSGNASAGAPHVHFERKVGGRSVNPYTFLVAACR